MTTPFQRLVILDFEATCRPGAPPTPQEIIEFPSVLIDLRRESGDAVIDEFEAFVRPVHHPELSEFCTELTSIRQEDVADAPIFSEVFDRHLAWLRGHNLLGDEDPGVIVTCGDWDLATMLPVQCRASERSIAELPPIYRRWINIKKIFRDTRRGAKAFGMATMLNNLGLELLGRHHRGIDDCRNIARMALALAADGADFSITTKLSPSRYPPIELVLHRGTIQRPVTLNKRVLATLLGLACGAFRDQIMEARTSDGTLVDDAMLAELAPGTALTVLSKRDLAAMRAENPPGASEPAMNTP